MKAAVAGLLLAVAGIVGSSAPAASHTALIAFSSNRSPWFADHVFTVDTRGRDLKVLGIGADPALSPDGKLIAYRRGRHIWLMNRNGSHSRPIAIADGSSYFGPPMWSPDQRRLAYAARPSPSAAVGLVVLDLRSRRKLRIAQATAASWSPDARRLAFIDSARAPGGLVVANADGSGSNTIVENSEGMSTPAWSADGKWLAYTRVGKRWQDLYRIRPDGTHDTRLTRDLNQQAVLSWSPDGRWLAYLRSNINGSGGAVRVLDVRGLHSRPLRHGSEASGDWAPDSKAVLIQRSREIRIFVLRARRTRTASPRSPAENLTYVGWLGARRLLFSARIRGNDFDLYTMRPDRSGLRRVTSSPAQESQPAWSPNGQRLAFVRSGAQDSLCIVTLGAARPRCRTSQMALDRPAWSPNGRELAYVCDTELCLSAPDGSDAHVVERDQAVAPHGVSWSPNGRELVFASRPPDGALWLLDIQSGALKQLTAPRNDSQPAWSPVGRQIVFRRGFAIDTVDPLVGEASVQEILPGYLHPAWSSDGRRVVFDNDDRLFVAGPDDRSITALTRPLVGSRDAYPAWRP